MSSEAETAVVGALLRNPDRIGEVVGAGLEASHFERAALRLLFGALVDGFYEGRPLDALTIAELNAKRLSTMFGVDEPETIRRVQELAARPSGGDVIDHAALVKRDADYRALTRVLDEAQAAVEKRVLGPDEVAGIISQRATRIVTSAAMADDFVSFGDAGRQFVRDIRQDMAVVAEGREVGAKFGLPAVDRFTRGLQPEDLWILAGEPGIGKSAVAFWLAMNFADRQAQLPGDKQVGTLILSLEMGHKPTNARFAAMLSGVDGSEIREATLSNQRLTSIIDAWAKRQHIPLVLRYAPTLRASQLRAIISEAVRRFNVGIVLIDHFRYFHLDQRAQSRVEEDGDKTAFLVEQICKPLNVAVICLAHTRKPDQTSNGRPRLSDLRGSQEIAGHASFVSFVFRPWLYATESERDAGIVEETQAEMIWAKNRHGLLGTGNFLADFERMYIS